MPLLYESESGAYGLYSEADLMTGTYCGSVLAGGEDGMLTVKFAPEQAAEGPVVTTAPFTSPWRFLVMGDLAEIMDNTMPENLSPDSVIEDTSWIESGVSNWTWLNGDLRHDQIPADKFETEGLRIYKEYVDFAAEMGWEYQLLDEGWMIPYNRTENKEEQPGYDPDAPAGQRYLGYYSWTEELVEYAKSKGVKLMFGCIRTILSPRNSVSALHTGRILASQASSRTSLIPQHSPLCSCMIRCSS